MKFNSNLDIAFLVMLALVVSLTSATKIPASKAPIVFVSIAHPGEFNPLFHIALELANVAPSENIWIATTEERRKIVEDAGLTFASLGNHSTSVKKSLEKRIQEAFKHGRGNIQAIMNVTSMLLEPPMYGDLYKPLVELIGQVRPKLMVVDGATWVSQDVAIKFDIREYLFHFIMIPKWTSVINNKLISRIPLSSLSLSAFAMVAPFMPAVIHDKTNPIVLSSLTSLTSPHRVTFADILKILINKYLGPLLIIKEMIFNGFGKDKLALTGSLDLGASMRRPRVTIATTVWGLEYPFLHRPNLHLVGTIIPHEIKTNNGAMADATTDTVIEWIEQDDRGVILISLGSATRLPSKELKSLVTALIEISQEHNIRILWKLPQDQHDELLAFVPHHLRSSTFCILAWIPNILSALANPKVVLNINHAGSNSFHEGLYFGKPQLLLPYWMDCYGITDRAVDAGVGLTVKDTRNFGMSEVKRQLVRLVTDDSFRRSAEFWGEKLRRAGGAERSAAILQEVLGDLEMEQKYNTTNAGEAMVALIEDPAYLRWLVWVIQAAFIILGWKILMALYALVIRATKLVIHRVRPTNVRSFKKAKMI